MCISCLFKICAATSLNMAFLIILNFLRQTRNVSFAKYSQIFIKTATRGLSFLYHQILCEAKHIVVACFNQLVGCSGISVCVCVCCKNHPFVRHFKCDRSEPMTEWPCRAFICNLNCLRLHQGTNKLLIVFGYTVLMF